MTEREKDEWILAQVKIMPEDKLEDVYKSLTGIKKIINMPGRDEIDEFCNNSSIQCQIIISASQLDQKFINTDKIIGKYYYDEETTGKTLDFSSKVVLSDLVS